MRSHRELKRLLHQIREYGKTNQDIAPSVYNLSGAVSALHWVLGMGLSPLDKVIVADRMFREGQKCITKE